MAGVTRVGIIGCGNISGIYLTNCRRLPGLELVACADLDLARAQAKAAEHGIRAASVDELLADPAIDLVINLTIPAVHAEVSMSALAAGKHVYTEKPLATRRADGAATLALAREKGCASAARPTPSWAAGCKPAAS